MAAQDFESLITALKQAGYAFSPFREQPEGRTIFLRHDVDFSIDAALDVARRETALRVTATYFFLLTSNFYNLLAPKAREAVSEIRALGHTVSLHFDPTAHRDLDEGFAIEKQLFEHYFDVELKIVSLHRPQGFLGQNNRKLAGVRHTYEDAFFRDLRYISDSGGGFRHGHPLETEEFRDGRPIHLLLHPIWWSVQGSDPSEKLRTWQAAHHSFIHEETRRNCGSYDGRSAFAVTSE